MPEEITNEGLRSYLAGDFGVTVQGGQVVDRFAEHGEATPPAVLQPGQGTPPSEPPLEARPEIAQARAELVASDKFPEWTAEKVTENFAAARAGETHAVNQLGLDVVKHVGQLLLDSTGSDATGIELLRRIGVALQQRQGGR